jgi:hydroxymethylglutaryl-CoA lyase
MPDRVRITDVSPRDGLQNEPGIVSTEDKFRLIGLLAAAGVDEVEATSFVSPRWVPQLADASELVDRLTQIWGEEQIGPPWSEFVAGNAVCDLSVLVPNQEGMLRLLQANIDPIAPGEREGPISKVAVFTSASETFSRKNTNASIAETLKRFEPVIELARQNRMTVRGYISCAIACPFEGPIDPGRVLEVARGLLDLGVDEIDAADTIGAGTPQTVQAMLRPLIDLTGGETALRPPALLTLHLHDTFGRAVECVGAALDAGVRSFDGAASGLGGCPYAGTPERRAPGNVSTEALVRAVHEAGFETGVDLERLAEAAAFASAIAAAARAGAGRTP